ncbi:MAG: RNA methyltransferase [Micromonosporaceae bacterium]|nr:RNA methyltransferase [Micromonosporaceae bacterium]
MVAQLRVTTRNARFQEWTALLANRTKRQRSREFLVQGVRPITMAVRYGWEIRELLYDADTRLSAWARQMMEAVPAQRYAVAGELMAELGGKEDGRPELLAVVGQPEDDLRRIPLSPALRADSAPASCAELLVVVFDRPTSPGNIGTVVRSADALGAAGVIVTGHAADIYDPKCVRASTGSLFGVPVVRAASHRPVLDWLASVRSTGVDARLVGTDEHGDIDITEYDFTGPTVLLVGNETAGLSAAWRQSCDHLIRIPMVGSASSLNAATAASIVTYECLRQRRG